MADTQNKQRPAELAMQQAQAVPPNLQEAFVRVVKAGMKVMFSPETHQMMIDQLNQEGDLAENIGQGMAGLMLLLYQKSNRTMPAELIAPAGTYLLLQGADFLEQVTGEEITPDILAQAMETMVSVLLEKFGIDKGRFTQSMEKAAAGEYTK